MGKKVRTQLGCFPAWKISVDSIKKRRIVIECFRKRFKQIGRTNHIGHASEGISLKCNGCIGTDRICTACKTAVRHIVLHNLNHIARSLGNTCNLIKCNAIPVAHKAHSAGGHIIEHIGHGSRTATHQDRVGGKLTIGMGLTGATGAKFHQVIVLLDKWHETQQIVQFLLSGQFVRFITGTAQHQGNPLILGKVTAGILDLIQIKVWHLDRLQRSDLKGGIIAGLLLFDFLFLLVAKDIFYFCFVLRIYLIESDIANLYNAPNATY